MTILSFLKYLRGIFNINLKSGSVHHAVIQSIYDSFILVDKDIDYMRLEMCLSTASGNWLDYWGDFFTVYRKANETDSNYSRRIIESVIRPKTTIPAIKDYIVDFLNEEYNTSYTREDVNIREPFKDIGKLSHKGLLSKDSLFYSGDYYRHAILDISIPERLTQDLVDLVHSVKAAGVKIIWSFLNSYGIVTGFNDVNWAQGEYSRWTEMQTQRNNYSGLILSNTSPNPYLSGRREIWTEFVSTTYWYAKMLDKETDKSILITKLDLVKLLDHYKITETLLDTKDTGLHLDINKLSDSSNFLSGNKTEIEVVEKLIAVTDEMLNKIQFLDNWLTLSQQGELSQTSGVMFEFGVSHEIFTTLNQYFETFKAENPDYYNSLQPPLIVAEHIAQFYAKRHINWLFDTPTMTQADFYELWEMGETYDNNTLEDIYAFEQIGAASYLTFGDVYQPPIVISGSPWNWTPIMDSQWLWKSETLTNEELEEIYRTKFSKFPDLVEIYTDITTNFKNALNLSDNGKISEFPYKVIMSYKRSSEPSMWLSDTGALNNNRLSGEEVEITKIVVKDETFDGFNCLSGDLSLVTKRKVVLENVPTLGKIIELEESQDVGNTNEDIDYSTRDWFQAPVQVGNYAQWLIPAHIRQLWNTKAISNDDIRSYWESADGTGTAPDNFKDIILSEDNIYQPPIVMTDTPFYWFNDHTIFDNEWLFYSQTLTNEDLEQAYWLKFKDYPDVFPDLIERNWITPTYPEKQFRLSDNAYMPYRQIDVTTTYTYHPDKSFILSQNSVISNRLTEYRFLIEEIPHPEYSFTLSQSYMSQPQFSLSTYLETHPEENFVLSESGLNEKAISGKEITTKYVWSPNEEYQGKRLLSGDTPEVIKTLQKTTYENLPLTYLSGAPVETETTYKLKPDSHDNHYLSGYVVHPYEEITVIERPVTLGSLIDLEEQQKLYQYSTRHILQSLIMIGEQVMWLVAPNVTQLWNTPILSNKDISDYWEGDDKPLSVYATGKRIKSDNKRYQPPIEFKSEPFYWIIRALQPKKLWDTPVISNESIARRWEGTPLSVADIGRWIKGSNIAYQPPIEIVNTIELFQPPILKRQLWDTPTLSNADILKYWEGDNVPTIEEFEEQHLADTNSYQPPIVFAKEPFYFFPEKEKTWLWSSESLTLDDLEEMYSYQFRNELQGKDLTLGVIIDLENKQPVQYSDRGICQSPISTDNNALWKVDAQYNKLWDTPAISNQEILSYWAGKDKPSRRNYQRKYLEYEPYYTLPIIIKNSTGELVGVDEEWLWKSDTLNNSDLKEIYAARLKSDNPILQDIMNYESSNSYSLRGNFQSPVEIIPQS